MPLFEAERHESLIDKKWSLADAQTALERIVSDTHGDFDPENLWPIHPLDRSAERPADSMKPLYFGAAGVLWALTYLEEIGATQRSRDYLPVVRTLAEQQGNMSRTAEVLGVERSNLYRKMKAFGIAPSRRGEEETESLGT